MSKLPTKIHSSVFNIVDYRVDRLRHGAISAKDFALIISPDDPFILIDDTIYALSESEYYASRPTVPTNTYISSVFNHIMELDDLSFMAADDIAEIANVKKALPNCPSCKFNRYKNKVYNIAKKYNIEIPIINNTPNTVKYPQTRQAIDPVVSTMVSGIFKIAPVKRKSCIECVEKHVAQAYILCGESYMGYPEYLSIGCGHLSEAIEETPNEADALKKTLIYCLGKSIADSRLFIPLSLILPHIHLIKDTVADSESDDTSVEAPPTTLAIDITPKLLSCLSNVSAGHASRINTLVSSLINAIDKYSETQNYEYIIEFEGALALLAELVVPFSVDLANTLRNIRLMFRAAPSACIAAGYDFRCITEALAKSAEYLHSSN